MPYSILTTEDRALRLQYIRDLKDQSIQISSRMIKRGRQQTLDAVALGRLHEELSALLKRKYGEWVRKMELEGHYGYRTLKRYRDLAKASTDDPSILQLPLTEAMIKAGVLRPRGVHPSRPSDAPSLKELAAGIVMPDLPGDAQPRVSKPRETKESVEIEIRPTSKAEQAIFSALSDKKVASAIKRAASKNQEIIIRLRFI
jgi:hypothetical protein